MLRNLKFLLSAVATLLLAGGIGVATAQAPPTAPELDYVLALVQRQEKALAELREQVAALTQEVDSLSQAVADLRATKAGSPTQPRAFLTPELTRWRMLRTAMPTAQVRQILGEPLRISFPDGHETWYYSEASECSWVTFLSYGVWKWCEPQP